MLKYQGKTCSIVAHFLNPLETAAFDNKFHKVMTHILLEEILFRITRKS